MVTLAQARSIVSDHLDDAGNDRWSTAQIDSALQLSLSMCIDDYCSAGGDRLDVLHSGTTSTSGELDLSSQNPLVIKGVSVLQGSTYWPIKAVRFEDRNIQDNSQKTLQVRYVPKFVLPTNTGHPLVGSGATAANSWDALDNWICSRAALFCSIKDAEARQELRAMDNEIRSSVLTHARIPGALPFPTPRKYLSAWFGYIWDQSDKTIIMVRQ